MPLDEYQRKRRFEQTPEPPPKLEQRSGNRFVVQKHQASHLHYDFRLEMEGVLKSWAVPKGPSLDPAHKRLAMMVEDHPVSYIDFEGVIPPGNYGAGTVMVWDIGTWEPEGNASEMLKKGDLKFRLKGKKLTGSFVLAHMKSRRPGSKGNEWLLIKHRDEAVVPGYDADDYDWSVLTRRSLQQIAEDEGSAEWQSSRPARVSSKTAWLENAIRKKDRFTAEDAEGGAEEPQRKTRASKAKVRAEDASSRSQARSFGVRPKQSKRSSASSAPTSAASAVKRFPLESLRGAVQAKMPTAIHPMLATLVDEPFSDADWLYEIKWDGYRAVAFLNEGELRLVSRNQNDMTAQYPELAALPGSVRARQAIVDGEIVALDEAGRSSFSLMQQRTGVGHGGRRVAAPDTEIPIQYYAFDLLYLDGFDLRRVDLEERKRLLAEIVVEGPTLRYSEHFPDGKRLYQAAKERGLEGIIGKRRRSCYLEKRSREWLKIKITQRQECVIGGYTDPRGSREHFGSIILGLYDVPGTARPRGPGRQRLYSQDARRDVAPPEAARDG